MINKKENRRQRHCMVVHNSYPFAETRVQREANALVDHGLEVDVICLHHQDEPAFETVDGVNVYRLPMRRRKGSGAGTQLVEYLVFFTLAFVRLTALYWQKRYEVIQVHNLPDFLVFVTLVPKLAGARVILDLHDLMPEFYQARFSGGPDSFPVRLIRWQEKWACLFANHVITVTELWRQTLIERGVPPEKCTVVMNLADDQFFHVPLEQRTTSQNNERFHLIYHGTLAQRYGLDLLLQALDLARREIPEIHLTVHGRGEYLGSLLRLADELNLGNHVSFSTRFVPTAELPSLIAAADLGVVPYRRDIFTDGILPTKLMEYALLGMPVIVARTPGISAYFDEAMVQFFTAEDVQELADCIQTLYHHRSRLGELARNIQKFNERYNWASQKAEYVNLVKGLNADKSE